MSKSIKGSYLLGIDLGTSGVKVIIIDLQGEMMGISSKEYPINTPRQGWAEQDPDVWMESIYECIQNILQKGQISPSEVKGIGLAGQMHSLVTLDQKGDSIYPAILWADQRSAKQAKQLTDIIGKENLAKYTGNPIASGFMLASWAWITENTPEIADRTRWLLLPKDYVRYKLTGNIGSEPSDASSTLLFNPHELRWSDPILSIIGLSKEKLPPISSSIDIAGGLSYKAASACGLLTGTPVVFGGSDVSLQALAQGIVRPGSISCTIGTGGQLFAPQLMSTHDPQLRLHLFCHVVPGTWHYEAAILSAGLALRWLRDGLWPGEDYKNLADLASSVQAAKDNLFFFPYLAGERTPYMDASLTASFSGLRLSHDRAHLIRSVMEGVVFSLRQGLELMSALGAPIESIIASGGATHHPLWLQLQADVFGKPVYVSNNPEATSRGAAILAGIGLGFYNNFGEAIQRTVRIPKLVATPVPEMVKIYEKAYQNYVYLADARALMNS